MKVHVKALKRGGHTVRKAYTYTRPGARKSNPSKRRRRSRR